MDKIMTVFIVVYILAIKQAFPMEATPGLFCPPGNTQCAESLKLTFHEIFSLKNAEAFRDEDGFLVMKYYPKKTIEFQKRNQIQAGDFFSWYGIKKITRLMGEHVFGLEKPKEESNIYDCSVTWFTKKKYSQNKESEFPKIALDSPLDVEKLEFENVFNKYGSFDYAHFVMHFNISLKVGFSDKARLSCNARKDKFDIVEVSDYFENELSIMGVFKPREQIRFPASTTGSERND